MIGSLELLQLDEASFISNSTRLSVIVDYYGKIMAQKSSFGCGFDNTIDYGGHSWKTNDTYTINLKQIYSTSQAIAGAHVALDYCPKRLYQTC